MTFTETCTDFWANRLPQGMKAQGKPKTFEALANALEITTYEVICEGLVAYIDHKPEDQRYCMASVFLNQQRWTAEYSEPIVEKSYEQRRRETEMYSFVTYGKWHGAENVKPTVEEARAYLHEHGWENMGPEALRLVK